MNRFEEKYARAMVIFGFLPENFPCAAEIFWKLAEYDESCG
jgi:hypothetical protein